MGVSNPVQRTSISQAATIEEMAEFWDEHDTADYWDQFKEVEFDVGMQPRHCIVIAPELYLEIEEQARGRGVQPETLVNLWLAERLRSPASGKGRRRARQLNPSPSAKTNVAQIAEESPSYQTTNVTE